MNEVRAWLLQSESDLGCGDRALVIDDGSSFCQAIAKYQQAVEKSIKGLLSALREYRGEGVSIGWGHSVEHFVSTIVRLSRGPGHRDIQGVVYRSFDESVRAGVRSLDRLAPRRPGPGKAPARNTEYPFQVDGAWHAPAEATTFSRAEAERFRELAHRVFTGCSRLISAMERE